MLRQPLTYCTLLFTLSILSAHAVAAGVPPTGVQFESSNSQLKRLFDAAEAKSAANVVAFTPSMNILVEGGGYGNAWIETQPMGGEMYAKRDITIALNNQRIFLLGQRADGRLPGMVIRSETSRKMLRGKSPPEGMLWMPEPEMLSDFEMFQGYCFPGPAWRMYFWVGKNRDYLARLYDGLAAHDAYLWRTRDSNGDGLLETWCVWDTGEDHSTRLLSRNAPTRWPFEFAPASAQMPDPQVPANFKRYWAEHQSERLPPPTREQVLVPFASMDVMSYSFDGRATLAKIARELGNGREDYWRQQAEEVRRRLIASLWDPARHACFDRDRTGKRLPEVIHNNLRCMWHGVFTQDMADAFIKQHLLNPAEFWTPVPLPSIAANDPLYRNAEGNSWSGQPQGLTYQRAIGALENYGHFAEVSLLGAKLLPVLIRNENKFAQQLDAQTGKPSGPKDDGYGPMMLAALEYISRMFGVHLDVVAGEVWWSAVDNTEFIYTQRWGDRRWTLASSNGRITAKCDGHDVFTCAAGVRVVTDWTGHVRAVVGIAATPQNVRFDIGGVSHEFTIAPNQVFKVGEGKAALLRAVPFDHPYSANERR